MNNIQIFNNDLFGQVRGLIIDEKPYFVASDVAKVLGYKKPNNAINAHCKHTLKQGILDSTGFEQPMNVIPMGDVIRLAVKSNLPGAEEFEEWIMDEVIPQLLLSGVYITESATQETIDYQTKFSVRRIRKTFKETTNPRALYEEFYELSKQECRVHHITNKDRISASKIIISVLQSKIDNSDVSMRASEKMALQELISDIQYDITKLANKLNGGVKSGQTKQINKLSQENVLLKEENDQWQTYAEQLEEYYNPQRTWYELPIHGFSTNFMFDENHNATRDYKIWLNKFPKALLPTRKELEAQGVVLNKRNVVMEIGFIHCEPYDVDNLVKSLVDVIFGHHLHINDNLIIKVIPSTIATCDNTNQGEIHFSIYNTDEVPHINSDTLYRVVNGRVELLNNDEE